MTLMTDHPIAAALAAVRARVAAAAVAAARDPRAITLVAVSKTHGIDAVRAAIAAGLSASLNSAGVTRFTRLSVHCAESSTAMSNV